MSLNNRFFIAGLICTSLSTALIGSPTKADDESKWYLTIGGGLSAIQDTEWNWGVYSGELQHSSGFSGEVGLGKDFGRSRIEITYSNNSGELDAITVDQAGTAVSVSGEVAQEGFFVTGLYELTDSEYSTFTPYVGAGIGLNWAKWENVTVTGSNIGDTWVRNLAGQFKVGTTVDVSEKSEFFLEGAYTVQAAYEDWGDVSGASLRTGIKFKF
tara:strand:+ start:279 stop:917 length:639 start_codon:yes stop_codon:yes gene_type:complete